MQKIKLVFVAIPLCLMLLASGTFAQEGTVAVRKVIYTPEVLGSLVSIENPNIENVIYRASDKLSEKLILSFMLTSADSSKLDNKMLELTAYRENGMVAGKSLWPLMKNDPAIVTSGKEMRLEFELEPGFADAARFTVKIGQNDDAGRNIGQCLGGGVTCAQCVSMAVDTCGVGNVKSVNCGATRDGSCSFECMP